MNSVKTPILLPENYGTPFEGGFYGGRIRVNDIVCAISWAPKALGETKGIWLPNHKQVPNAASCFDSMANTRAMAEAGSVIAQKALAANINGLQDWCIPARDVLEMGYRYLKPTSQENCCSFRDGDNASSIPAGYPYTASCPAQTTSEAFQKGNAEAFEPAGYWNSTQASEYSAFYQLFNDGTQYDTIKSAVLRCRFVRLIQLSS